MKIVAQMDDISQINFRKDSTFAILLSAQNQGHEIFYYLPSELSYDFTSQILSAEVKKIFLQEELNNHYKILEQKQVNLKDFDVILLRQDPPFNMSYITTTYLLEKVADKVLVLNNPSSVRDCPEKWLVNLFPKLTPPTIISSDIRKIKEFYDFHQNIIIKPLYGNGGEGIILIKKDDPNFSVILEMMSKCYDNLIVIQKFLPEVSKGDKRIILIDGEIAGAILRTPKKNEIRSNLHAGGSASDVLLTDRDYEICQKLSPELKKRGLFFVGIDIIGDYITEINVTSPTGLNEIKKLSGKDLSLQIVRHLERKILS